MRKNAVLIRPYEPADLGSVLSIWESASRVGHPFLSENFLDSERRNIPLVYLKNGDAWVAESNGIVVGFTILHGNEVGALFVNPSYHGLGVGFALLNKAKELHRELTVEVFKDNEKGNAFYARSNFVFVRDYFHEESGFVMSCLEYSKD